MVLSSNVLFPSFIAFGQAETVTGPAALRRLVQGFIPGPIMSPAS